LSRQKFRAIMRGLSVMMLALGDAAQEEAAMLQIPKHSGDARGPYKKGQPEEYTKGHHEEYTEGKAERYRKDKSVRYTKDEALRYRKDKAVQSRTNNGKNKPARHRKNNKKNKPARYKENKHERYMPQHPEEYTRQHPWEHREEYTKEHHERYGKEQPKWYTKARYEDFMPHTNEDLMPYSNEDVTRYTEEDLMPYPKEDVTECALPICGAGYSFSHFGEFVQPNYNEQDPPFGYQSDIIGMVNCRKLCEQQQNVGPMGDLSCIGFFYNRFPEDCATYNIIGRRDFEPGAGCVKDSYYNENLAFFESYPNPDD